MRNINEILSQIKKDINNSIAIRERSSMYPAYGLNSQVVGLKQALNIVKDIEQNINDS